jgi:hypothetical protein
MSNDPQRAERRPDAPRYDRPASDVNAPIRGKETAVNTHFRSTVMAAAVLAFFAMPLSPVAAQGRQGGGADKPPTVPVPAPVPRLTNGKPDLSGVWQRPYVPDMTKNGRGQRGHPDLPFTPAGVEDWRSYDAANGDYTGSCMPFGMSRSVNSPDPMQILQTDKYVALLFEQNTWFHVVPIDGRDHPKDVNPTWFGHSIGKWDGETLIVDTIGFNGWTRLDTVGHPHSDALHLVQTFRRTDADHLAYTITIDDRETYTKSWTNERVFTRMDGELIEYSCEENNKDLREGHIKAWTPPPTRRPK